MRIYLSLLFVLTAVCTGFTQTTNTLSFSQFIDSATSCLKTDSALSFKYAQKALALGEAHQNLKEQVEAQYVIARIHTFYQNDELAQTTLLKALGIAKETEDVSLVTRGYIQLASIERWSENIPAAIEACQKAIALSTQANLDSLKAASYLELGLIYQNSSTLDKAITNSLAALKLFTQLHDTLNIISSLNQLGNINLRFENYDESYAYFNRIEPYAFGLNDSSEIIDVFFRKGLIQQKREHYEEAIIEYQKSLNIASKFKAGNTEAILNGNIGSALTQIGQYQQAVPYLLKALSLKQKNNASTGSICHTYLDLSELYNYLGEYQQSMDCAQKVIDLTENTNDDYYRQYGFFYLAETQREAGLLNEAYDNLLTFSDLKDSFLDATKSQQLMELQIAYEAEKKDNKIQSLEQATALERTQKYFYLTLGGIILILGVSVFFIQWVKHQKSKEMLEKEKEIDTLKSNFFSNISHEFKTPLTLLLGPITTRLEAAKDEKERDELLLMQRNTLRLQRLINDLLDLSKSEAGQLELKTTPTAIDQLIKDLSNSFKPLANERNIRFSTEVDDRIVTKLVLTDKDKLETILINLLSNAFKYTPDFGAISIKVRLTPTHFFAIEVCDTGEGISKDQLNKIFDRFYQADLSSTHNKQGTGIGLSFSKELASLMGGDIAVKSTHKEGACFTVSLPLKEATASDYISETEPQLTHSLHLQEALLALTPQEQSEEASSQKPLLLLVEDHADVRKYIHSILDSEYTIIHAENGKTGQEKAFETIPDLIVSDVMMPFMNGFDLCQSLKSDIRTSHIPFVLLTAKSSAESRIQGLETQADCYLEKPFNPKELQLQIRNLTALHHNLKAKYQEANLLIPAGVNLNSAENRFIEKLTKIMEEQYANSDFNVQEFSREIGLSRSQLHRKLIAITGESPSQFIRSYRLKIAEKMLIAKTGAVSEIAYNVGFNSVSYFNRCFSEKFGKKPSNV